MTALSSYSTGTVSVSADGTIVTASSALWLTNVKPGDLFQSGHFCVPITDITYEMHLTITPWPGSTVIGAACAIWKVSQQRIVGVTYAESVAKLVSALTSRRNCDDFCNPCLWPRYRSGRLFGRNHFYSRCEVDCHSAEAHFDLVYYYGVSCGDSSIWSING
ncbi:hypothetical protein ABIB06_003714 [Bradyrhizobium sp. LB8.2]|uniref:hypothetical protein n=1 Tax=unclassified Bradyrhizobium TaxID=2631580 RepID=UPI003397526C